ncbi:hypothetical protein ACH4ZX_37050 [Streptomyces sp. NPDC020490]|uniref:hypothetical protein n=1 Tax=Streptomyces sp. NPDC020490 TaxID=3365078 RepID=UPI0037A869C2
MYIRIITETRPAGRLLYERKPHRNSWPAASRPAAPEAPRLALAGVDEDPAETHIVRGID